MGIGQRSLDVLHKRKQEKLSAADIELIVTDSGHGVFSCSKYLVVPRIRWAIDRIDHECDLLAMSKTGYLHEIEIKVSRSDLLADKPQMVVLNKADTRQDLDEVAIALAKRLGLEVLVISGVSGQGIKELEDRLFLAVYPQN